MSSRQASSLKGGLFLLKDPSFFIVCLLGFSTFFLRGGSSTTLIPLYDDDVLRLGPGAIGLLLTVSSLLHGLLIYPSGAMSDKLGRKIVIVPAGYLVGLTLFAVPFAHTTASFATIFLLLHVAQGWVLWDLLRRHASRPIAFATAAGSSGSAATSRGRRSRTSASK